MKQLLLLAGAAALASTAPALAKPGKGNPHGNAKAGAHGAHGGHGQMGHCPPGLAKKAVPCMPPGQAKKLFNAGQRVPYEYHGLLGYNRLPIDLRRYYGRQLDPNARYIYDDSYLYRVDPETMVVQQVLNAILRPY